jgi:hypothetical protein
MILVIATILGITTSTFTTSYIGVKNVVLDVFEIIFFDIHPRFPQSEASPLSSVKSQQGKEVVEMNTLQEKREKAECLARKARALGFTRTGFLVRDAYGHEVFTEGKIEELLGNYRAGDLVTIDVLLNLGRSKVKVEADRGD